MIKLETGEKIVYEVKKHWLFLWLWGIGIFILALMPLVVGSFVTFALFQSIPELAFNIALFFYTMWIGILWLIFFVEWTNYRLDVWIVTNQRIIDVDQRSLFHRDVATVRLEDVVDIKSNVKGVVGTFLKYGTVEIQTAGMAKEFIIETVLNPDEAKEMIYKAKHEKIN